MKHEEARNLEDKQTIYFLWNRFVVEKGKFDLEFTKSHHGYDTREEKINPSVYIWTATNFFCIPLDKAFLTFAEAKKANIEKAKRYLKAAKEQTMEEEK